MSRFVAALAASVLVFQSGLAQAAELRLGYEVRWAGLSAAAVTLGIDQDAARYSASAEVATSGVVRALTRFSAAAHSHGPAPAASSPVDGAGYEARYKLRGNERRTLFVQARVGAATLARRLEGDTSKRAELDDRFRRDAFDPIAALVALRTRLRDGSLAEGARFSIPVYDGRRRFDVDGVVPKVTRIAWQGESVAVRVIDLVLRPRAGFSGAELDGEDDPEDVERPARLTIGADAQALPYAFEASAAGLPLTVRLDSMCSGGACKGSARAAELLTATRH